MTASGAKRTSASSGDAITSIADRQVIPR